MSKPFDATTKFLFQFGAEDWCHLVGINAKHVTLCDVDLSTVTSSADVVLMLETEQREAVHFEAQASYDALMGERVLLYSVLGKKKLNVPVRSVVILLRPDADGQAMSGKVKHVRADGTEYLNFDFEVFRVWQHSAEEIFAGGLGVLPLALIADVKKEDLPGWVARIWERLKREAKPEIIDEIWASTGILMGLRYEDDLVEGLLKGVRDMEESTVYQAILAKGELKGERAIVLRLGTKRFGPPSSETLAALNIIGSRERLEILAERVLYVSNWQELLA